MAIQDKERKEIIDRINALPEAARDAAAEGFRLGHEEGWWLARTDPDTTVSPVDHAATTNPFNTAKLPGPGHTVVVLAYRTQNGAYLTKSKVLDTPAFDTEAAINFTMHPGETVVGYSAKVYAEKTDAVPVDTVSDPVQYVNFTALGTYTVKVKLKTSAA